MRTKGRHLNTGITLENYRFLLCSVVSKQICASSTPKAPDPDIQVIANRLKNVKRKILILSGKGGVGKSTLTAMLARALANSDENINVGVLDIDLCGPSCPRVFGVANEQGNFTRKHKLYNLTRIGNSEMEFPFSGKIDLRLNFGFYAYIFC